MHDMSAAAAAAAKSFQSCLTLCDPRVGANIQQLPFWIFSEESKNINSKRYLHLMVTADYLQ